MGACSLVPCSVEVLVPESNGPWGVLLVFRRGLVVGGRLLVIRMWLLIVSGGCSLILVSRDCSLVLVSGGCSLILVSGGCSLVLVSEGCSLVLVSL